MRIIKNYCPQVRVFVNKTQTEKTLTFIMQSEFTAE